MLEIGVDKTHWLGVLVLEGGCCGVNRIVT